MANTKSPKTKQGPATSVAEAIAALRTLPAKQQFKSAAEAIEAAAPGTKKSVGQRVRQLKRDAGEKVGRGKTYAGITPGELVKLYEEAQAEKASKASKAQAKSTATQGKSSSKAKATA